MPYVVVEINPGQEAQPPTGEFSWYPTLMRRVNAEITSNRSTLVQVINEYTAVISRP